MKILITGAKGNFPTLLAEKLEAQGHQLNLLDIEPMSSEKHTVFQADIRDSGAVHFAMQGCDAVVHAMAYHGNMSASRNEDDYHGVNVTGTHNVLLAMKRHGIKNLVFSSSEVVYCDGMKGRLVMDEETPTIPTFTYAMTKVVNEEMCRFYSRVYGLRIAMMRYGCFVPADWKTQGMGRLNSWLDREDVADSNLLALNALAADKFECEAFLIQSAKPFVDSDWPTLHENPSEVVERYWPGSVELLAKHGLEVPKVRNRFDISKSERILGYQPKHNFGEFVNRLKEEPLPG